MKALEALNAHGKDLVSTKRVSCVNRVEQLPKKLLRICQARKSPYPLVKNPHTYVCDPKPETSWFHLPKQNQMLHPAGGGKEDAFTGSDKELKER